MECSTCRKITIYKTGEVKVNSSLRVLYVKGETTMKNTGLATFQTDVIDSAEPVIVDFYSDSCPPCKRLLPLLENLEAEGLAKIVKLRIEDEPDLAVHFGISALPTLLLFKNGKPIKQLVGLQSKTTLIKFYNEAA